MSTPRDDAKSPYDRPHEPWVCGLACEGRACSAGPSPHGECPAAPECTPQREGDRWICNRSALRGGECDTGPTPEGRCGCVKHCVPLRSLRKRRGRFVAACAMSAIASLLLALNDRWRNEIIAPGPLTTQHAQLLRRGGEPPQCAACHSAANQGAFGWTASLVIGHDGQPTQSELCMKCHETLLPREFAESAHNVPHDMLVGLRKSDPAIRNVSGSPVLPVSQSSSIACATCHKEHHGEIHDLTAMTDRACQTCHQQTYESFATDHPGFANWPYERRTPIAFDHGSHQSKHFSEKKQAFDCRTCHIEDRTRSVQLLANYQAACASCHDEKLATSFAAGVPMFVLPTLDVNALRSAGHDIGLWPVAATGDFDGRLPPAMKLLLAADPAAAQAMSVLGPDFEFFDVDAAKPEHLAACAALAQSIKRLMTELSESGATAVQRRLTNVAGREVQPDVLEALAAGLSGDTLRLASSDWLGRSASSNKGSVKLPAPVAGAWFYDATKLSIRYQPVGHADTVLVAWLDFATAANEQNAPVARAMLKELSRPTAPGLCASCHSVEQLTSGRLTVHWRPADRTIAPREFTKFDHGPHVLLPELANCAACHAINPTVDSAESYVSWDPRSFVSDFRPMDKQACAKCHTSKAAGDNCQKCHNYHVTVEGLELRVDGKIHNPPLSTLDAQPSKTSSGTLPARR